jgi:hypothetical protein
MAAEPLPALPDYLLPGPLTAGDVVALRVPRAPWGKEPLGVATRIKYRGGGLFRKPATLVWVEMDDGTGEQPFLTVEVAKVDMAKWEAKYAGEWTCACMPGVHRPADQVVCGDCGRARPWR